jgi:vacuolar-type H+-ATPase subunit H
VLSPPGARMDLDRLIATEQRLDEALRRARGEAAQIVAAAQAAVQRGESELESELAAAADRLTAEIAGERARREQDVRGQAAAAVARYAAVSPERVSAVAREIVDRLVAGETAP